MAIPKKVLKLVQARDSHCVHCGLEEDLVPHHRRNRGMGGSKLLDIPENLLLVCARYNSDMEADLKVMKDAKGWGHKLSHGEDFSKPVFDLISFSWWKLLPDGTKVRVVVSDYI